MNVKTLFVAVVVLLTAYSFTIGYGITLTASSERPAPGQTTCVDITATSFNDVVSMQYTLKWEKNVLKFKEVKPGKLPGLSEHNFGTRFAEDGKLTHSWYDMNVRGISVPDGATLYTVCYDVIGKSGDKAYIQFTSHPTITEITNVRGEFLDLTGMSGKVQVK